MKTFAACPTLSCISSLARVSTWSRRISGWRPWPRPRCSPRWWARSGPRSPPSCLPMIFTKVRHYLSSPSLSSTPWHACWMIAPTTLSAITSKFSIYSSGVGAELYKTTSLSSDCEDWESCKDRRGNSLGRLLDPCFLRLTTNISRRCS